MILNAIRNILVKDKSAVNVRIFKKTVPGGGALARS
jgi:hypothetical protein